MDEDRDVPATKADVQSAVEQLRSEMNHQYRDVLERIDGAETRLLNAFYGFAQSRAR